MLVDKEDLEWFDQEYWELLDHVLFMQLSQVDWGLLCQGPGEHLDQMV